MFSPLGTHKERRSCDRRSSINSKHCRASLRDAGLRDQHCSTSAAADAHLFPI